MKSVPIAAAMFLAGCGADQPQASAAGSEEPDDGRIFCRIGNAREFERFCTVEQAESEAGPILIVRKPSGGFRRFLVTGDGRGVVAADGAETARVTIDGENRIEVAIGGDTFRLPATVQSR